MTEKQKVVVSQRERTLSTKKLSYRNTEGSSSERPSHAGVFAMILIDQGNWLCALGQLKASAMETIWDWLTVFAFAGLVTLMLNRSSEEVPRDRLIEYLPAAGGCAVINYLGNEGMVLYAILLSIATLAYVFVVLKPQLPFGPNSE